MIAAMTTPLIRPAAPADLPAITAIYAESVLTWTASFEIDPPDAAEMTRRWRGLIDDGFPYLAAESDGVLLGYAYAGPYRLRPGYRWCVEDSIYIAPAAQGRGVGRALLTRLIAECEARDFRQMIAVIGDTDNAASIALHRAADFRLVGTFEAVGFKFGRWIDSVLMQRALGAGQATVPLSSRPG